MASVSLMAMGDGDWMVYNVVTDPEHRRTGLQSELWKEVLADADRLGAVLMLDVRANSREAILRAWYERLGFYPYGGTRMVREVGLVHGAA